MWWLGMGWIFNFKLSGKIQRELKTNKKKVKKQAFYFLHDEASSRMGQSQTSIEGYNTHTIFPLPRAQIHFSLHFLVSVCDPKTNQRRTRYI